MKAEIRRFAENTSVKGVSRFMKATKWPIRALWFLSVIGLFCVSMVICTSLVLQYLDGPKAIKLDVITAFQDYLEHQTVFSIPDVTVCNQNPLTGYADHDGMTWEDYFARVEYDTTPTNRQLSPRGYLEYLGPRFINETASSQDPGDFILDCSYGLFLDSVSKDCGEVITMKPYVSVTFSQCVTLSFVKTDELAPMTLSLVLYIDESQPQMISSKTESTGSSGAVVTMHESGQIPDFEKAKFVSTGQFTSVQIQKSVYKRLPDAGESCWDYSNDQFIQDLSGRRYNYSQNACLKVNMQAETQAKCGCMDSDYLVLPGDMALESLHFCGALSDNDVNSIAEMECIDDVFLDHIDAVADSCLVPCEDITQSASVSSCNWPSPSIQLSIYEEYIHEHPTRRLQFPEYTEIYNDYLDDHNASKAIHALSYLPGLQNSLLKLQISTPELHAVMYTAHPQMTLSALLASIGGNLNLWSGISAIIVIEVVDLFIRLVYGATEKKPNVVTTGMYGR